MEMQQLHGEVARLQAIGLRFGAVKRQISDVVAAQRANREALAAVKGTTGGSSGAADAQDAAELHWVQQAGGVWLRLPAERAERVLRAEAQQLGTRLEGLFAQQKQALAHLEQEGLGPEHFAAAVEVGSGRVGGRA